MAVETKLPQYDGWSNIYTGRGIKGKDKRTGTKFEDTWFGADTRIFGQFFDGEGMIRRIVALPVEEMLRPLIKLSTDLSLDTKKVLGVFEEFFIWNRLYGGAVVVAGLKGTGTLKESLNGRTGELLWLRTYNMNQVIPVIDSLDKDPESIHFGEYLEFDIHPLLGVAFRVHRDRLWIETGALPSPELRLSRYGLWGNSIIPPLLDYVNRYINAYESTDEILMDFIQTILQIDNLAELIEMGKEDIVRKRLEIIDLGRASMNTILLDATESFSKIASSVSGLDKVLQEFTVGLAGVADMPVTKLVGRSPAGENATGDSDTNMWYDKLDSARVKYLEPFLLWLGQLEGKTDLVIEMDPFYSPTPKDIAESHKFQADADAIYLMNGVVRADEIRQSRFGEGYYSYNTTLSGPLPKLDLTDPLPDGKPTVNKE